MKVKVNELTGPALDWAVAKCMHPELVWGESIGLSAHARGLIVISQFKEPECYWSPSTNWEQGGPIIERDGIELVRGNDLYFPNGNDNGEFYEPLWIATRIEDPAVSKIWGTTPLIAAMRCFVASKIGDEVDIPEELK